MHARSAGLLPTQELSGFHNWRFAERVQGIHREYNLGSRNLSCDPCVADVLLKIFYVCRWTVRAKAMWSSA